MAAAADGALPPVAPEFTPTSSLCPRVTWTLLHVAGLGLLWAAGAWTPLSPPYILDWLAVATLCLYAAASLTNPGYIPPAEEAAKKSGSGAAHPLLDLPQCVHCSALQVARAKHCHDCGRCVRRLDHHCWWLGNCVGIGNHRLFLSYLTCEASLLVGTGALAAARGVAVSDAHRAANAPWPPIAASAALSCVAMCTVLGLLNLTLLAFQCGLVLRGETTWEHLRRERINASMQLPPGVRPYDRGPLRNCVIFCCGGAPGGAPVVATAVPVMAAASAPTPPAEAPAVAEAPRRSPHEPPYGL